MNEKEDKFIKLANNLYQNHWKHFTLLDPEWTNNYQGEEQIFAIVIRTLVCNDANSKKFFIDIGGYQGVINHYTSANDLEEWLGEKISKYSLGTGKGSHRDNRHKSSTPEIVRRYIDLTEPNQTQFLEKVSNFHVLMTKLTSVKGIGPLTAFDISKRLIEAKLITYSPQQFYLTGSGEINGIKALYPSIKRKKHLERMGNQLMQKILEETEIPLEIAFFGVEDLLCIYQKDKRYMAFLECKISVAQYSSYIRDTKCVRERGVC